MTNIKIDGVYHHEDYEALKLALEGRTYARFQVDFKSPGGDSEHGYIFVSTERNDISKRQLHDLFVRTSLNRLASAVRTVKLHKGKEQR